MSERPNRGLGRKRGASRGASRPPRDSRASLSRSPNGKSERPEKFRLRADGITIERRVLRRNRTVRITTFRLAEPIRLQHVTHSTLSAEADRVFLKMRSRPAVRRATRTIRVVDLFSGCGAMSLGVAEACRALGYRMKPLLAVDLNKTALVIYKANFPDAETDSRNITELLKGRLGSPKSARERALAKKLGKVDLAIGGPPCQGHSDLNNRTRRSDPKNALYARMARFAEIVRPRHIIIENVSAVLHDRGRVVQRTRKHLKELGYHVDDMVLEASAFGTPQTRRRHILAASLKRKPCLADLATLYGCHKPRTVRWAIWDLRRLHSDGPVDQVTQTTKPMRRRIDYLFDNRCYNLPNGRRPKCHRDKKDHSYKSVYGRIYWDRPAQTITSGFTCMGQGRFVHPGARRTITPHEAARLQFIPDFFSFDSGVRRTALAEMIANAVPAKLTYVVALDMLR